MGAHFRRGKRALALRLLERFTEPDFFDRRRIHDRSAGDHQLTPTVIDLEPVAWGPSQNARVYVPAWKGHRPGPPTFRAGPSWPRWGLAGLGQPGPRQQTAEKTAGIVGSS